MKQKCKNCSSDINKWSSKYCSNKCQSLYQRKTKIDNGTAGYVMLRSYLLETNGHECEMCGLTEWMNQKIPLVCDHIDGNSENNILINLRMICCNCDALLPTYKSRNRGNGRHSRRIRYAAGLSY